MGLTTLRQKKDKTVKKIVMTFYTLFKNKLISSKWFEAYADYQKIDFLFSKSANVSK